MPPGPAWDVLLVPSMLQIGRRQASETLVDLLLGCHGRIRSFLALAVAIGERSDVPDDEIAEGAARVRRYFAQALPLHIQDEEESLLPRLDGRSAELDSALEQMRAEHSEHAAPLRQLLASVTALSAEPRNVVARGDVGSAATALISCFAPHLEAEERVIFPAIGAHLSADEQRVVVEQLRRRRQAT